MRSQYPGIRLHLGYFRIREEPTSPGQTQGEMRARLDGVERPHDEPCVDADHGDLDTAAPIDPLSDD